MKYYIIILIMLFFTSSCSAADTVEVGAEMIEEGIRQTGVGFADDIYDIGNNVSGGSNTIIMMASYTVDPYLIPAVQETNSIVTDIFYCLFVVIIFGHATVLILNKFRPEKLSSLKFVTVDFNGYHYRDYVVTMTKGIFILALAHFGIQLVLELEHWITLSFMQNVPASLEPAPENVILYMMMALIWLSLLMAFIIRAYVIVIFAAFALIIGAMYLFKPTEQIAITMWKYFLSLAFMQPIIVGISCLVVRVIQESSAYITPSIFGASAELLYYFGLLIILFLVSTAIVLGPVLQLIFRVVMRKVI